MLTKVCLFKAMVLPVVMYGCESWTVKKAECQRIDAFEEEEPRWQRSRTGRTLSPPQIHQKNI